MPPAQEFKLWLMVYFGDPDKHWTRHIALFFQAPEGKPHITYHVKKVNQAWKLEMLDEYDAMKSINIVGKVSLGNISITPMQLKQIMESVKIINNVTTWKTTIPAVRTGPAGRCKLSKLQVTSLQWR